MPLIEGLKIGNIFKDKDKEEGDSVMDTISTILQLLREEFKVAS